MAPRPAIAILSAAFGRWTMPSILLSAEACIFVNPGRSSLRLNSLVSNRMRGDLLQQQFADPLRRLVGGKMPDAGQHFKTIGRGDEIDRAFGGEAADGVVGIAPDIERRHPGRPERAADRAARTVP